jgi:N-acetylneuraminic acid mutarotase
VSPRRSWSFAGAAAVAALAACGGSDDTADAVPTDWRAGPALPGPRLEAGVAALGDRLAVVGGFDATIDIVATAHVLDPLGGTWAALPDAPVAWTHLGLAGKGGALYLLGGLEGPTFVPRGDAYVLPAAATAWQPLPAMPAGRERGAAGIAVGPEVIYVVGGATQTDAVDTVLAYDVGAMTWTELPRLPSPRSHPAAYALADGTLIVAGGLATIDSSQPLAETVRLRPGESSWTTLAPMPAPRGGCAAAALGARLICAGGEAGDDALAGVIAYDVAADAWLELDPMPEPRAGTQGAAIGSRLYVPGGARVLAFIPLDTLAIYAPF